MSKQEIRVPDLGGAEEVEVIEILVGKGDQVAEEDPLLTLESDKASVELPAPGAGKIVSISVKVGDKLKEGDVVGAYEPADGAGSDDPDDQDDGDSDQSRSSSGKSDKDEDDQDENTSGAAKSEASGKPDESGKSDKSGKTGDKGGTRKELVKVPALDGFEDVPVIELNVSEGDTVSAEEPLVTVESDKATMEIPSPFAGKIVKLLVAEGDKLSEGDELLEMEVQEAGDDADDDAPQEASSDKGGDSKGGKSGQQERKSAPSGGDGDEDSKGHQTYDAEASAPAAKVHAGPAVRKLARELGADLGRVKPSGPKDRILKDDVEAYIRQKMKQAQEGGSGEGAGIPAIKLPDFTQFGEVEREAMSRMHVATAVNMQRSWLNIPHVTQFDEADITGLEDFRKGQKTAGEKRGVKLTPLPFLLKACAAALAELPQFNVSLDMGRKEVVRKKYIHIGIAVDTPAGLMVPVIRDVDQKGLWQLAQEASELAEKARDKKLKPAEMQGACFTITSLGGIGGTAFTPIVNAPEVAILGVSKAATKPVWDGSSFQPRLMLPLSLSYDHRAVNGADAARFTNRLSELLGDIRQLLL